MKKKLIIANWKMNPVSEKEAVKLARAEDFSNVVIAPPFPFLSVVGQTIEKAALGSQDIFWEKKGAFTGEVSAGQLKSVGVKYIIIGHSERRMLGETDVTINKKAEAALKEDLRAILCVGEPWSVRKRGIAAAKKFVKNQLQKDLISIKKYKLKTKNLIIAYEPVWAIGAGRADKPAEVVEMAKFIKAVLNFKFTIQNSKILYGGSVIAKNVKAFLNRTEIDGALIGGASLRPKEFRTIATVNI